MQPMTSKTNTSDAITVPCAKLSVLVYGLNFETHEDFAAYLESSELKVNLENKLNFKFKSINNLIIALSHRSFVNEKPYISNINNERFEFLGDSLLNTAVTIKLVELFPSIKEGDLSKLRSAIVNEHSLAEVARYLNLQDLVLVGRGVQKSNMIGDSIISDTFEAILASIFFDSSFEELQTVLYELAINVNLFDISRLDEFDPKSRFQEKCMEIFKQTPVYESTQISEEKFEVKLLIKGEILAKTVESSKKKGQHNLALKAIRENMIENLKRQEN